MKRLLPAIVAAIALPACSSRGIDRDMSAFVASIRAVDNHAHVVAPDIEHDTAYDALRCEILPAAPVLPPANLRFGPDTQAAWLALYGVSLDSDAPEQLDRWRAGQRSVRGQQGTEYFNWVLDQAGIEIALANRLSMASQLDGARFRWVPYGDALLFPLDNTALKAASPDRQALFAAEEQHLRTSMLALGVAALPPTLDAYLDTVVEPTLQQYRTGGAVALKFEAAYLRALDFKPVSRDIAADVFARYAAGSTPPSDEYTQLQDFLFREIAARAGRLGLVIQMHTGGGCGASFQTAGANPLLLEPMLNDPSLQSTRFVLLHGASPFDRQITGLILKPNVWVDTSMIELLFSPPALARMMRPWLELAPERVLFGTDAGPFGPGLGWEETTWLGSRHARTALADALTDMINEGVVSEERAQEIATRVMRQNAMDLYGWK